LYGLLHDPRASEILEACNVDLKLLEKDILEYLDGIDPIDIEGDYTPIETLGFRRVVNRAVLHIQNQSKAQVDGGNVLVALYGEPDSHAAFLLKKHGVERLDIVSFISHGVRKKGGRKDVGAPAGADSDDPKRSPNEALEEFTTDLYQRAAEGRIDPLIGRGKRDRTRHPRARAAPEEQPAVRGRFGRRQDGHRGRAREGDLRRQRPRRASKACTSTRSTWAP
jgi:ATP-dependent Clp protease ATP-binding subunit ClpA